MYCRVRDRFLTNEQCNKHLSSGRHLRREVIGFWPAYFPQRKLTRDEGMKLEKVLSQKTFVTKDCI